MKIYKKIILSLSFITLSIVLSLLFSGKAHASVAPSVSLGIVDTENSRVTAHGDPHSAIELHYGPSAVAVAVIGTTDDSGDFSTTFDNSTHDLSQCNGTAYVVINGQQSPTISWSAASTSCGLSSSGYPSFSQNNIILNVGQNLVVTISGNGGYSISNNSNSTIINASISGNILNLYANSFGGSNITVCESDGQCSVLSVVAVTSGGVVQTASTNPPAVLSSFTVSSNDANGYFMNAGAVLTLSFNTNQQVGNVWVSFAGTKVGVSGSGPYTASYTVTGNEGLQIPVVIGFTDLDNRSSQTSFSLGSVVSTTVSTPPITTPTPVPVVTDSSAGCAAGAAFNTMTGAACATVSTTTSAPTTVGDGYVFSSFIKVGSTGTEVTELQKRLTALGFYSGPVNGNFGPLTEAAVKSFQKSKGITQAGYVGPSTRAVLNK